MKPGKTIRWTLAVVLALAGLAGLAVAGFKSLRVAGPHTVADTKAALSPALLEAAHAAAKPTPRKMSEAIERALAITDRALTPGDGVPEAFAFDLDGKPGSSEAYAHLYARVLEVMLEDLGINARVYVVQSPAVTVFGARLDSRTWVYVQERRRKVWLAHHVDPALHDRFGRWNIFEHVADAVPVADPNAQHSL